MMTTFGDRAEIKKVQIDTLEIGSLENQESRAIMEILIELADDNLEVKISETEMRTLLQIYLRMWHAESFIGLRELIESDIEVELFFLDLRELVVESDPATRSELWKEAYKGFCDWVQHPTRTKFKFGVLSVQAEELLAYAQEVLMMEYQWDLYIQRPLLGRQYKN